MKLIHVTPFFLPYFGGIEYYIYYVSRELVKRGHSVSVYTSRTTPNLPEREYMDGVLVRRFTPVRYLLGYPLVPKLFEELLKSDADLIHCHISGPMMAELAATASKLKGLPLVVTVHQCALPAEDMLTERRSFAHILTALYKWLLLAYDLAIAKKVILVSPSAINLVSSLVKHHDKLVVIPCGVDTKLFRPKRLRGRLSKGPFRVLYVGRFMPFKGLDTLIEAFYMLRRRWADVRLLLVGKGPTRELAEKKVEELRIMDQVEFLGQIPSRDDLVDIYNSSDVFVLPSRSPAEGFGIVLLEAMACGLPVVATRVGGIPYVLGDGAYGKLVKPRDPHEMASALDQILSDGDQLSKLRDVSRDRARYFNWNWIARRIEEVYEEVLGEE